MLTSIPLPHYLLRCHKYVTCLFMSIQQLSFYFLLKTKNTEPTPTTIHSVTWDDWDSITPPRLEKWRPDSINIRYRYSGAFLYNFLLSTSGQDEFFFKEPLPFSLIIFSFLLRRPIVYNLSINQWIWKDTSLSILWAITRSN